MPEIARLSKLFDTKDKAYRVAIKDIVDHKLSTAERRLYSNRVCQETHKSLPTDTTPSAYLCSKKLRAVIDKIIRLLDAADVPRKSDKKSTVHER